MSDQSDVPGTYDRVADEYVRRIYRELEGKPFDREILGRFAERVRGREPVYDLGCGPGHVARYLLDRGVRVTGLDLSPGMVARARELNPGIEFRPGDMRALDDRDQSVAGLVAFYSIIHIPPDSLAAAFREFRRVLAPDCPLLLAFHIGAESIHLDEWWGHRVAIDFFFLDPVDVQARLVSAGFRIVEAVERDPYPEVEHQSRRAYILAESSPP